MSELEQAEQPIEQHEQQQVVHVPQVPLEAMGDGISLSDSDQQHFIDRRTSYYTVTYKCKCGAVDHDKVREDEQPVPAINCWKCGGGKGLDIGSQLAKGIGMLLQKGREPIL